VPPLQLSDREYVALAELRFRLRSFLAFSEAQAKTVGLEPRQHQLLLALRGLPPGQRPTIGTLADRLILKHHTAVELVDRLERLGLVRRDADPSDGRVALVSITARGQGLLERLSVSHRSELAKSGPALVESLQTLLGAA
jgi:DNA-binding MarR family transcriptional regulator